MIQTSFVHSNSQCLVCNFNMIFLYFISILTLDVNLIPRSLPIKPIMTMFVMIVVLTNTLILEGHLILCTCNYLIVSVLCLNGTEYHHSRHLSHTHVQLTISLVSEFLCTTKLKTRCCSPAY